jgi:hypothetical protein
MRINESRCKVAAYSSKLDVSTRKLRIRSIRSAWLSITSNVNKIIQLGTVLFSYSCDKQIVQAGYLDGCLMGWIDDNQPEIIKPLLERLLAHARDLFSRNRISGSSFDLERYSVAILGCY